MTDLVLLTGCSGFIAKHITLRLLNAGYTVRGSLRNLNRADEVRAAVSTGLTDPTALDRLSFVPLDLNKDDGWHDAIAGASALVHTASPFPLAQPKNADALIKPAVDGTLRALRAANSAGVKRTVLTSSIVAMVNKTNPEKPPLFTEEDWSDPKHPTSNPYGQSKTLAERAAWDFVAKDAPEMTLTTINPGLVLGPALDAHYGSSLEVVARQLSGKDPMVPDIGFAVVDVRDIAEMHLRALQRPETAGLRIAGVGGYLTFKEMAEILKSAYPDRKIATRQAPTLLLRALALFDPQIRAILPTLGLHREVDNTRAQHALGIEFIARDEALLASAKAITTG